MYNDTAEASKAFDEILYILDRVEQLAEEIIKTVRANQFWIQSFQKQAPKLLLEALDIDKPDVVNQTN